MINCKSIAFLLLILMPWVSFTQELPVAFLNKKPQIDGIPKEEFNDIPWRNFEVFQKTNKNNPSTNVQYKVGYTYDYLYLIIASDKPAIEVRDRAYQNGDGFHLVLAKPEKDSTAEEFYVLKFSPEDKAKHQPASKRVWYYNIDLSAKTLSPSTHFKSGQYNGKTYFELLMPWSEVPPYHPLFTTEMGFNLCFVMAVNSSDKNYYFVSYDRQIQSELSSRKYIKLKFDAPSNHEKTAGYVFLKKNHIITSDSIELQVNHKASSTSQVEYTFTLVSAEDEVVEKFDNYRVETNKNTRIQLVAEDIVPGNYIVCWENNLGQKGSSPLTVLPEYNLNEENKKLNKLKPDLMKSDFYTLSYKLKEWTEYTDKLKDYETAADALKKINDYNNLLQNAENGNSLFRQNGTYRRAFLSAVDSTLQPYSIKLPANYCEDETYPLFVMLHGSGSTDEGMLYRNRTPGNFIEIAPLGRGTSNCFTRDFAEIDVKEAIDDVVNNYPVDTNQIIIAGFSMGGYGALRIFYEYPKLFKGVAVLSGHPYLAKKWFGSNYPNFTKSEYTQIFSKIPVFIYHSKNDLNCPWGAMDSSIQSLTASGADVTVFTTEDGGHNGLQGEIKKEFFQWLTKTLQ